MFKAITNSRNGKLRCVSAVNVVGTSQSWKFKRSLLVFSISVCKLDFRSICALGCGKPTDTSSYVHEKFIHCLVTSCLVWKIRYLQLILFEGF